MKKNAVTISNMTEEDIPECLEAAREFHGESVHSGIPFDESRAKGFLYAAVYHNDIWSLISKRNDNVLGGLIVREETYVFSQDMKILNQVFMFVRKPYRGGRSAVFLMNKLIELANQRQDIAHILFSTSSGISPDTFDKFTKKFGFSNVGGMYRKEMKL